MDTFSSARLSLISILVLGIGLGASNALSAQTAPRRSAAQAQQAAISISKRLSDFLRRHPDVAEDLRGDPSLVNSSQYVDSHPELRDFLARYPEVRRNPEAFLSPGVTTAPDISSQAAISYNDLLKTLDAHPDISGIHLTANGYEVNRNWHTNTWSDFFSDFFPFLVFLVAALAILWIFRIVLTNRRWNRIAKVQADTHAKLLEKFSSGQELMGYIQSEPGKRFLESAPIAVDIDERPRLSAPLGRILWSLQVGLILALAGIGLLCIRNRVPEGVEPLLVFGTLGLTLGIGFVLSAAVSFGLTKHLGLMQVQPVSPARPGQSARPEDLTPGHP
ncbi:MAG: hypothetical protein ACRD2O_05940 [Terriglobia bacterium]